MKKIVFKKEFHEAIKAGGGELSTDREFEPFYADSSTLSHENLICPYCQQQLSDSYEYFNELEGCTEMSCPSCDATFLASRTVRFSYYGCKQRPKLLPKTTF